MRVTGDALVTGADRAHGFPARELGQCRLREAERFGKGFEGKAGVGIHAPCLH